jgi:hypothetical protein
MNKSFYYYSDLLNHEYGAHSSNQIIENIENISHKCIAKFNFTSHNSALLVGHVQSGKTGNLIGVITKFIDSNFKFIIYLTSDNNLLYDQTYIRLKQIEKYCTIINENDEITLFDTKLKIPTVILLKKNQSILRKWIYKLSNVENSSMEPLLLIDDEADAASLNTQVNRNKTSTINKLIKELINSSVSSLYLQTTATPYANLLLNDKSGMKPDLLLNFKPGEKYLGGDFFYGESSTSFELIDENDGIGLLDKNQSVLPNGIKRSLFYFISQCIIIRRGNGLVSNFLIHPSHKISDHLIVSNKINSIITDLIKNFSSNPESWLILFENLNQNQPNSIEEVIFILKNLKLHIINSENEATQFNTGLNIIIGGNSLGRGLTIPQLNTCYYVRNPKAPQADTVLQHSRIFGYDRNKSLSRIFLTKSLLMRFRGISKSIDVIHDSIIKNNINHLKFILPKGLNATRKNVVDNSTFINISGGVNYFLQDSSEVKTDVIDDYLSKVDNESICSLDWTISLLNLIISEDSLLDKFKTCLELLKETNHTSVKVYIRNNRSISKNTGTLLSPDDRLLSHQNSEETTLFLYRLNGELEKGWSNKPLWIPNLKFPNNCIFLGSD